MPLQSLQFDPCQKCRAAANCSRRRLPGPIHKFRESKKGLRSSKIDDGPFSAGNVMDFEKRLERALSRGANTRSSQEQLQTDRKLTDEQLHSEHSRCRLELSEQIETCLRKLADYCPGFRFETVVSDAGWGARVSRDDIALVRGRSAGTEYSRLEVLVRPFSSTHIIELVGKGTIRNKELFQRTHYQFLNQVDLQSLLNLVDLWVLEYAEMYAARS
jgi:hypothetical protein